MKKKIFLLMTGALLFVGISFVAADRTPTGGLVRAQEAAKTDEPKMPEVITLGKDSKLGPVTFNHVKHNGGTYSIDKGSPIACTTCHHTAQPAAEIAKLAPLKTAWPADRTTTLTAELFAKDPKAAGVASCRDCHAKQDTKPKLLDAIPQIKHEGSPAPIVMTNMQAFHRTCSGCHTEVKKTVPLSKGPTQMQCTMCHKKTV